MSAILAAHNVRVQFSSDSGRTTAVDGVDLSVNPGEVLGLVGESGCGKSTLAMAIAGLLPATAQMTAASLSIGGTDLTSASAATWRQLRGRTIGMIFQDPLTALTPWLRIGEQVAEPLRVHLGMSKRDARRRAIELLEQVGLPDPARKARAWPHECSGGQRQRVAIAIALACEPQVLIADEPTTALDVTVQDQVLRLLRDLQRDRQMAMILITHDLGVVAGTCDHVAVMYGGRVVEQAPTEQLFAQQHHPYTRGLLGAVPHLHGSRDYDLATIPGLPPRLSDGWGGVRLPSAAHGRRPAAAQQRRNCGPPGESAAIVASSLFRMMGSLPNEPRPRMPANSSPSSLSTTWPSPFRCRAAFHGTRALHSMPYEVSTSRLNGVRSSRWSVNLVAAKAPPLELLLN